MNEAQTKAAFDWCLENLPATAVLNGKGPTFAPFREHKDRVLFDSWGSVGVHPWTINVTMTVEELIAWVREREEAASQQGAAVAYASTDTSFTFRTTGSTASWPRTTAEPVAVAVEDAVAVEPVAVEPKPAVEDAAESW